MSRTREMITCHDAMDRYPGLWRSMDAMWGDVRSGRIPKGVVVRLGRRIRLDADRLNQWVDSGCELAEAG